MLAIIAINDGTFGCFCDDSAAFRIDEQDRDVVGDYNWFVREMGSRHCRYVTRSGRAGLILLHREIMQAPRGEVVDHINGDGTDNRRMNLRIASVQQNRSNVQFPSRGPSKTGLRGVHPTDSGRFEALISIDRKLRTLGTFDTAEEAARAWDKAARDARGPFTFQNYS